MRIQTTDWFTRGTAPPPLNNAKLVTALFGDDVLRNKRNTEAVEIAPGRVVVARVLEHKPAALRPLDEVRAGIAQAAHRRGGAQARARGRDGAPEAAAGRREHARRPGASPDRSAGRTRRESTRARSRRCSAPTRPRLPAYVGVDLPPTGYGLYRVSKVTEAKAVDEARLRAIDAGLARQEARDGYQAFVDGLRSRAKIEINEANSEEGCETDRFAVRSVGVGDHPARDHVEAAIDVGDLAGDAGRQVARAGTPRRCRRRRA